LPNPDFVAAVPLRAGAGFSDAPLARERLNRGLVCSVMAPSLVRQYNS
jgi:hypothetical protein